MAARSNRVKNLLDVVRKARALLASVFLLSASGVFITDLPKVPQPAFVVEMRSDTNGVAQLFFDVGRGINESDSVRLPINASTSYKRLRFSLPGARVRALRFDPIDGSGTFSLRSAAIENPFGVVRRPFALSDLKALNQIASRAETPSELTFSTVPSAADPMLQIAVRPPVNLAPSRWQRTQRVAIQFAMCMFVTVLVGGIYLGARLVLDSNRFGSGSFRHLLERTGVSRRRQVCRWMLRRDLAVLCCDCGWRSSWVGDFALLDRSLGCPCARSPDSGNRQADSKRRMGEPYASHSSSGLSCDSA